jgi:hypothetical protein
MNARKTQEEICKPGVFVNESIKIPQPNARKSTSHFGVSKGSLMMKRI